MDWAFLTYDLKVGKPLHLAGPVNAHLWVSSKAKDGALTVRVEDVSPGGKVTQLSAGWQMLSLRKLDQRKTVRSNGLIIQPYHPYTKKSVQAVKPGRPVPVDVEIYGLSGVIQPGHRLRVSIQQQTAGPGEETAFGGNRELVDRPVVVEHLDLFDREPGERRADPFVAPTSPLDFEVQVVRIGAPRLPPEFAQPFQSFLGTDCDPIADPRVHGPAVDGGDLRGTRRKPSDDSELAEQTEQPTYKIIRAGIESDRASCSIFACPNLDSACQNGGSIVTQCLGVDTVFVKFRGTCDDEIAARRDL